MTNLDPTTLNAAADMLWLRQDMKAARWVRGMATHHHTSPAPAREQAQNLLLMLAGLGPDLTLSLPDGLAITTVGALRSLLWPVVYPEDTA